MPFDGLVMAAVCGELKEKITGSRIEKIYQPAKEELTLLVSRPREKYRLLLSANAGSARVHLTEKNKPNPSTPPLFCMVLRKHLEGGYINEVFQPELDRVLHIKVNSRDELGRPAVKTLIIEVMGKHSNIILVDENNKIIDGIKRYSHSVSRYREVLPGRDYLAPPDQGKIMPVNLEEERFIDLVASADLDTKLTDILLKIFDGFSPCMCREVIYRTGLPNSITLNECGQYELSLLWQKFSDICSKLSGNKFNPTLVIDRDGSPKEFAAFNLTQFKELEITHGSMNFVLDQFFSKKEYIEKVNSKKQSLLTVVKNEINRLKKKLPKYKKSLQEAARAEDYRLFGELLTANMHRLEKGMKKIELENYYHPEFKKVSIELNPQLTPSENVQSYFKKYTKAKNTASAVQEQLSQAKNDLQYLEAVENAIRQANTMFDLEETEQELISQRYLKPGKTDEIRKKKEKQRSIPKPLQFKSSDGFTIMVGKNNRQNDYVTQRIAQPDDIWMHTKEIPGSHVVIRTGGSKVPDTTLEEAAVLAAYHSKARNSSTVPVDYTFIKHVRKPKGAKPGMVIYDNQQTIYITPDENIIRKLLQESY